MKTPSAKPRAPTRRKTAIAKPDGWTGEQRHQIAKLAYERFLARGGYPGDEMQDWLEAEAEFAKSLQPPKLRRVATAKA
jgi:hypothetical protein